MRYVLKWYRICLLIFLPLAGASQSGSADLIWDPNDGFIVLDDDGVDITDSIWTSGITPPPPNKAYQALIGFRKNKAQPFEKQYTVCPWNSFRFQKYYTYQIDLICDSVELAVLQEDDHLFSIALLHVATAYPTSIYNSELLRRWDQSPGRYKIHIPTIGEAVTLTPPGGALDITKNGLGGWYYEAHWSGIGIAVKELNGNLFQVSAAMFLKSSK